MRPGVTPSGQVITEEMIRSMAKNFTTETPVDCDFRTQFPMSQPVGSFGVDLTALEVVDDKHGVYLSGLVRSMPISLAFKKKPSNEYELVSVSFVNEPAEPRT